MRVETAKYNINKNLNAVHNNETAKTEAIILQCYVYWKAVVTETRHYWSQGPTYCDLLRLAQLQLMEGGQKTTCKTLDLYTRQKLYKNTC